MRFRPLIEQAARRYNLDPDLVEAVVEQESSGRWFAYRYEPGFFSRYLARNPDYAHRDPREVSSSYGLMQVMFTTAIECGFTGEPWELFNPTVALDLGCNYLAKMLRRATGQWGARARDAGADLTILRSALASYNGGAAGNAPDQVPDRNRAYADEVLDRLHRIKQRRAQEIP